MRAQHVRQSSKDAFFTHQDKFSSQRNIILTYIGRYPHQTFTRREVATFTGIETSSVAARVRELLDEGELYELPRRRCSITGISSHCLMLRPEKTVQVKLFA